MDLSQTASLVSGALILIGSLEAITAAALYLRKKAQFERSERLPGVVERVLVKQGIDGDKRYHLAVKFVTKEGAEMRIESSWGLGKTGAKSGDDAEVIVDKNDPSKADVYNPMIFWSIPAFIGIGAFVCFLIAPVIYLVLKPH